MPRVGDLSLAIHPVLLAVYHNMKLQIQAEEERRKNSNRANAQQNKPGAQDDNRFPENRLPCSKIVFINLDGYES
jgi:hypothetical protein